MSAKKVDATMNAFGKPCQTVLSALSLLRYSGDFIKTLYILVERWQHRVDTRALHFIGSLSDKIQLVEPDYWLKIDAVDMSRFSDKAYRYSLRYQYAFEHSQCEHILVIHNDVHFHKDIIRDMQATIGDAIITGRIGQCWNCPAERKHVVEALAINDGVPCCREHYEDFHLSFNEMDAMYKYVEEHQEHYRNFLPKWNDEFRDNPWPLPECRVNEVCCLINVELLRKSTVPKGRARPFGAYASAGSHNMDVSVAWFRDVHRQGYRAKYFDTDSYYTHFIGHSRMFNDEEYRAAEQNAATILREEFSEFVPLLERVAPGLLTAYAT